jgi:hypothetical protein
MVRVRPFSDEQSRPWMAVQAKRNPLKRSKDRLQGLALLDAVAEAMPHYPLDPNFEADCPRTWRPTLPNGEPSSLPPQRQAGSGCGAGRRRHRHGPSAVTRLARQPVAAAVFACRGPCRSPRRGSEPPCRRSFPLNHAQCEGRSAARSLESSSGQHGSVTPLDRHRGLRIWVRANVAGKSTFQP